MIGVADMDDEVEFSAIITHDTEKHEQYRLQVKHFRGKEWLHFRRYYLTFEGDWAPTRDGISLPMEMSTTTNLFKALVQIISVSESRDVLSLYLADILRDLYDERISGSSG